MTNEITNVELHRIKVALIEINSYHDPRDASFEHVNFVLKAVPDLIAKVESLAADAERYRHMRNDPWPGACREFGVVQPDGDCWIDGPELDSLIDAAKAKEKV